MHQQPKLSPRPEQALRVSAKLITASTILQLSSDELERAVTQEQMDNPTLEVTEQRICQFCATRLYGLTCTNCGHTASSTQSISEVPLSYEMPADLWSTHQQSYDFDNYGFAEIDRDDQFDLLASIPTGETLTEMLLHQLQALILPDDEPIAEQLVGNLNERGYLEISIDEIAGLLQVSVERVEYVLRQLHTLEPTGIGARNPRECLLIQLQALSEQEEPPQLVYTLIDRYLDKLGRSQFAEIARDLKVSEQAVREANQYIRSKLYPFPTSTYLVGTLATHQSSTTYIRPDVLIRKSANGFDIELIEARRYSLSINPAQALPTDDSSPSTPEIQRYLHTQSDRAKFFIECIHRRWRTLYRIAELLVGYQRDFLEHGIRYLRPLTRAEVAKTLNLDEGTVSRAIANKYALLPNGRLMPLSDFFDSSLSVKDILKELIASEDPKRRLSDDELAKLMHARGISMARRTVTKYREEMGIGSSRERG